MFYMGDGSGNSHLLWRCCCGLCSRRPKPGLGRGGRPHYNPRKERLAVFQFGQALYTRGCASRSSAGARASDGLRDDAFQALGSVVRPLTRRHAPHSHLFAKHLHAQKSVIRPPIARPPYRMLYVGASLLQETGGGDAGERRADFGIVGPGCAWQAVQNDFHQFIGIAEAKAGAGQLQQEFGAILSYERCGVCP